MLTDPSYAGQLLVLTYPMIGNYGVDAMVEESAKIQPTGLVVREMASFHSHLRSEGDLSRFLKTRGVVAIDQVDTRAVTRRIRNHGVMPATITTTETAGAASERLKSFPDYDRVNWAATVTTASPYAWPGGGSRFRIALLDGGVKRNIMRSLTARGCSVDVFPLDTRAEDILAITPDGILLSPGPGNPDVLQSVAQEVSHLIGKAPIFGICLGHQIVASAAGAKFFKLPFGHRGGNHPVKDLATGGVTVTAQNHGYAVDAEGLPHGIEISHINLNDETVEGLTLRGETCHDHSVPFRGESGAARQHADIRPLHRHDGSGPCWEDQMTRTTSIRTATEADADAVAGIAHAIGGENTGLPEQFGNQEAAHMDSQARRPGDYGCSG